MIGMPDREKISGFELCANGKPCIGEKFTQCPFSPRNNDEQNCGVTMARFALALLKEQESGKVLNVKDRSINETHGKTGFCPRCNQLVVWGINRRYCGFCGKEVKWE